VTTLTKLTTLHSTPLHSTTNQTKPQVRDHTKALISERDELLAKLLEHQRAHSNEPFYPDCNGSLRISAGHCEGYAPSGS
jgi:hypothetical protein